MRVALALGVGAVVAALSGCGDGHTTSPAVPTAALVEELHYGAHAQQRIVAAVPAQSPKGVVVWVHGGGWLAGDPKNDYDDFLAPLAAQGYSVVSVGYRLGPATFPLAEQDVAQALQALLRGGCENCTASPTWDTLQQRMREGYLAAGGSAGGPTLVWALHALASPGPAERLPACASTVVAPIDLSTEQGLHPTALQLIREHLAGSSDTQARQEMSLSYALHQSERLRQVHWHVLGGGSDVLVDSKTLQTQVQQLQQKAYPVQWHFKPGVPDGGHGLTTAELQNFLMDIHRQCFDRESP